MIRSLVIIAAFVVAGTAMAQAPTSPWPAGAGVNREDGPTVSARATGTATGTALYRGRITVQRRGATRDDAAVAMDKAVEEMRAIGGVEIRSMRRDIRTVMEPPQMQPSTPSNPLPAIPPRGQMVAAFMEVASVDVEAPTRKAIQDWSSKIPPMPAAGNQMQPYLPQASITERLAEDDPAWQQATRNGLLAAERNARDAATAAGGELGRLLGMWTERLNFVTDGVAQVTVTAEYQVVKPRR